MQRTASNAAASKRPQTSAIALRILTTGVASCRLTRQINIAIMTNKRTNIELLSIFANLRHSPVSRQSTERMKLSRSAHVCVQAGMTSVALMGSSIRAAARGGPQHPPIEQTHPCVAGETPRWTGQASRPHRCPLVAYVHRYGVTPHVHHDNGAKHSHLARLVTRPLRAGPAAGPTARCAPRSAERSPGGTTPGIGIRRIRKSAPAEAASQLASRLRSIA